MLKDLFEFLFPKKNHYPPCDSQKASSYVVTTDEIDINNVTESVKRISKTNVVYKDQFDYALLLVRALEWRVLNDEVVEVIDFDERGQILTRRRVKWLLNESDIVEKRFHFLVPEKTGIHKIGGKPNIKAGFDSIHSFSFIGSINRSDPHFSWLGIDELDIYYPLNSCCLNGLYLDFSNPELVQTLNPESLTLAWDSEHNQVHDKEAFFEQKSFISTASIEKEKLVDLDSHQIQIASIPIWNQGADIPKCPKSGEVMDFVVRIESDKHIALIDGVSVFGQHLIFRDMGNLFVFWQPETKVMFLIIQD